MIISVSVFFTTKMKFKIRIQPVSVFFTTLKKSWMTERNVQMNKNFTLAHMMLTGRGCDV